MSTHRAPVEPAPAPAPAPARPDAPRPLALRIDRLVLDGLPFSAAQGAHVRAALEQELTRLWMQREARASLGDLASAGGFAQARMTAAPISAPPISATASAGTAASPGRVGRDAARSLFSMLRFE